MHPSNMTLPPHMLFLMHPVANTVHIGRVADPFPLCGTGCAVEWRMPDYDHPLGSDMERMQARHKVCPKCRKAFKEWLQRPPAQGLCAACNISFDLKNWPGVDHHDADGDLICPGCAAERGVP